MKEKLTLSVNKEVIEKAKQLGINISEITEKILRGYTSAQKPEGKISIYDGYNRLFDSILPLLKEFDVNVEIAQDEAIIDNKIHYLPILLQPDGLFYHIVDEYPFTDIREIDRREFLSPHKIIENLVNALVKSEEAEKEKLQEIMMAKRIIDAMREALVNSKRKHIRSSNCQVSSIEDEEGREK